MLFVEGIPESDSVKKACKCYRIEVGRICEAETVFNQYFD